MEERIWDLNRENNRYLLEFLLLYFKNIFNEIVLNAFSDFFIKEFLVLQNSFSKDIVNLLTKDS